MLRQFLTGMKNLFIILAGMITVISAQTIPNLPIPAGAGATEVWNDSLYFFGGSNRWAGTIRYPRIYKFDGAAWTYHDSIPDDNVWDVISVLAGDDVYLLGGWPSGERSIRKYNLSNRSWTYLNLSPYLFPYGATAEHWNGFIYLFNRAGNVYEYDIANDSWAAKTPNTIPGYDLSSVVYQDEIYIVGYYDSTFYKYSPATGAWTQLQNTPYPVSGCGMGIINGNIYCAGGSPQGAPGEMRQTVLAYDAVADSWSEESFQLGSRRILMAGAMFQNRFYVLGGFDSTGFAVDIVEEIVPPGPVGIGEAQRMPGGFLLEQNYPNPFNPVTTIRFYLPSTAPARLEIFNVLGQLVRAYVGAHRDAPLPAGWHEIRWDGRDNAGQPAASGVYFYRLQAGDFAETKRLVILR